MEHDPVRLCTPSSPPSTLGTDPGILCVAPLVEVPQAMFPLESMTTIPIVSWFCVSTNALAVCLSSELTGQKATRHMYVCTYIHTKTCSKNTPPTEMVNETCTYMYHRQTEWHRCN